jgi:hypothetical protein
MISLWPDGLKIILCQKTYVTRSKFLCWWCVLYHHKSAAAWFAPLAKREEPNGHARVATCGNHLRHSVSNWLDRRSTFARVGVGTDQPNVIGPTRACRSTSIRLLLVEVQLALYCQHVPSRRHFLKVLFVMWVHQHTLASFRHSSANRWYSNILCMMPFPKASKRQVKTEPAAGNRR